MSHLRSKLCVVALVITWSPLCRGQQANSPAPAASTQGGAPAHQSDAGTTPSQGTGQTPSASQSQADSLQKQIDQINSDLQKQQNSDFGVTLGIGSLIVGPSITDYSNQSNVLQANSLGRATPQYLIGVSMRSRIPNVRHLGARESDCVTGSKLASTSKCELWRRRPWEAFISLKFSPQSSQTLNGYVLGGSYAIAHYLDALIGYALSPINEPAPGFRIAAANYVTQQQKSGLDMNFNPTAMSNNAKDAFDGFPITDTSGKLIYSGTPLEIHYRGGVVFGVSLPVNFGALFNSKNP